MALVSWVARRRLQSGAQLGRRPQLGTRDLQSEIRGVAGELWCALFTGRVGHLLRDDLDGLPDVGDNFDAKAIDDRRYSLLIPEAKLQRGWVYFLVLVNLPQVEVLGAIEGSAILARDVDRSLPHAAFRIRQFDPRFVRGGALERFRAPAYLRVGVAAELERAA